MKTLLNSNIHLWSASALWMIHRMRLFDILLFDRIYFATPKEESLDSAPNPLEEELFLRFICHAKTRFGHTCGAFGAFLAFFVHVMVEELTEKQENV